MIAVTDTSHTVQKSAIFAGGTVMEIFGKNLLSVADFGMINKIEHVCFCSSNVSVLTKWYHLFLVSFV
jgi:hypothetical protein